MPLNRNDEIALVDGMENFDGQIVGGNAIPPRGNTTQATLEHPPTLSQVGGEYGAARGLIEAGASVQLRLQKRAFV